jgi:hypothetical protein
MKNSSDAGIVTLTHGLDRELGVGRNPISKEKVLGVDNNNGGKKLQVLGGSGTCLKRFWLEMKKGQERQGANHVRVNTLFMPEASETCSPQN